MVLLLTFIECSPHNRPCAKRRLATWQSKNLQKSLLHKSDKKTGKTVMYFTD